MGQIGRAAPREADARVARRRAGDGGRRRRARRTPPRGRDVGHREGEDEEEDVARRAARRTDRRGNNRTRRRGRDYRLGRRSSRRELGAAKEKIKELEWRLQRTKRELEKREELEALSRDALNAAKASGREKSDLKKQHARELEEMINVFEKKRGVGAERRGEAARRGRDRARARADDRGVEGGGGGGGGGKKRGKEDFFRYLDAFQRQTDELPAEPHPGEGLEGAVRRGGRRGRGG